MAKLVEHAGYIVRAEESGLARRGFGEVGNVIDDWKSAEQLGTLNKAIHPCAAVLVVAFEVIAVPQRQRFAVGVRYLEYAHIRVVHGNVVPFLKREAIELVRRVE